MASSLDHSGTAGWTAYVLHGPSCGYGSTADDGGLGGDGGERDAGRARLLGVSNVSRAPRADVPRSAEPPAFVQNRCYAVLGWDREVRAFCRAHGLVYQGFSLLTANRERWRIPSSPSRLRA